MSAEFESAQEKIKTLKKRPSDSELLELYALYKQGTAGDVNGERPGMLKIKDRAKYDAWAKVKGLKKEKACEQYVQLVNKLAGQYGFN